MSSDDVGPDPYKLASAAKVKAQKEAVKAQKLAAAESKRAAVLEAKLEKANLNAKKKADEEVRGLLLYQCL